MQDAQQRRRACPVRRHAHQRGTTHDTRTTTPDIPTRECFQIPERKAICRRWFAKLGKENPSEQQVNTASRPEAASHLPLYLVLFCSEAAHHAIFETIDVAISEYPLQIGDLWVKKTLARLEGAHDEHAAIVKFFMQQLLAARGGISLTQIKDAAANQPHLFSNHVSLPEVCLLSTVPAFRSIPPQFSPSTRIPMCNITPHFSCRI